MKKLNWIDFKYFVDSRGLSIQEVSSDGKYYLLAVDGLVTLNCDLWNKPTAPSGSDQEDYEDNYQTNSNNSFSDKMGRPLTKIDEEDTKTGGHYQAKSYEIDVGSGDTSKSIDVSFPVPISLLSASWKEHAEFDGDEIEMGTPPVTTGAITSDVAIGDTVINVSSTVIDNARVGGFLQLTDGTNTDKMGVILEIGSTTLTMQTATTNVFAAATPTYCQFWIDMYCKSPLDKAYDSHLGESKIGGSYIPTGSTLRATYYNNDATAKKFRFTLEYLY